MISQTYDFIVVGSGSAGGIVASRLSESGKYRVLCLEAGDKGPDYVFSKAPAAAAYLLENPKVNWCYYSEPDESHGGRQIFVPRGKMLGGSSSINGMIYNRGQKIDYDTWGQMGNRGWSYDDVLPYLKKLENTKIGDDKYRGRSGPIHVTEAKPLPFHKLFIAAAKAAGVPYNSDYAGETQDGVCMAQQTIHRGMRESTASKYLAPASKRPNLTVLAGAEAEKLILEGKRCVGVQYRRNGQLHEARASQEVIVSCGTANNPKLLELSGIGNPDILAEHGITPLHELRGVGENLRDHYAGVMKWRFNTPDISIAKLGRGWRLGLQVLRYGLFRSGFISEGIGTMRVFTKSRPDLENPDIMLVVAPYMIDMHKGKAPTMSPVEGFFMYSHLQRTESSGSVHIRSKNPTDTPKINFKFLQTEGDRRAAIDAIRLARRIVETPPFGEFVAEELEPGQGVQSDAEILDFLIQKGTITHHMVGTCRMGTDPMAVVDERLRVHGLQGLRIADASIMPTVPSGNTNVPCMMVGEKCADMVLEDALFEETKAGAVA